MTYQVLARKWRPRTFQELVGQEHVLRALVNALDNDRLHHAFLFTGTRGVGKTTIARILAKSLNCERGVSSVPCGECSTCAEIDESRFVDLIEVDAASRTKVDDTRELLDNVQYAPTRGRYKVYLVDEVHMLSTHSFNALLKTLEEPPPHVKFLFATTDPQKVPVTILSRCLQFNLKRLPRSLIRDHLDTILASENVEYDKPAVELISGAADGSMRDALSLLDQAISFCGGRLPEEEVREMLGAIEQRFVSEIVAALAEGNASQALAVVDQLDTRAPDYGLVLEELAALLQRMAVLQMVPDAGAEWTDRETVAGLAERLDPEDVQLFYQIAITSRRDLAMAPDPRGGFEMAVLRMLAFRPAGGPEGSPARGGRTAAAAGKTPEAKAHAATGARASESAEAGASPASKDDRPEPPVAAPEPRAETVGPESMSPEPAPAEPAANREPAPAPASHGTQSRPETKADTAPQSPPSSEWREPDWVALVDALGLGGMVEQLARNCVYSGRKGNTVELKIDRPHAGLATKQQMARLGEALSDFYREELQVRVDIEELDEDTPARRQARRDEERTNAAREAIATDPNIKALKNTFDATVDMDAVKPLTDQQMTEQSGGES